MPELFPHQALAGLRVDPGDGVSAVAVHLREHNALFQGSNRLVDTVHLLRYLECLEAAFLAPSPSPSPANPSMAGVAATPKIYPSLPESAEVRS